MDGPTPLHPAATARAEGDLERSGRFRIRLARTQEDVDAALRMRFQIFNVELGEGLDASWETGRDEDAFDGQCDHLLVEDLAAGEVVGTYRLQTWERAREGRGFYSAGEFDLDSLPREVVEASVEVGRACVAKAHRNRRVLFLLWRGLAAYMMSHGKRYLFGCSSITTQDPNDGLRALADLEAAGHLHPSLRVLPHPGFECGDDGAWREREPLRLPILFRTYLRYGAKICGPPAIDRAFKTVDFLVLLDLASMDPELLGLFLAEDVGAAGGTTP